MRKMEKSVMDMPEIIKQNGNAKVTMSGQVVFIVGNGAKLVLDGELELGANTIVENGRSTIVRMDENSTFIVHGDAKIFYGADIHLMKGAVLEIGNDTYLNKNARITAKQHIKIGDGCAISHELCVLDSDYHKIDGVEKTEMVEVGNHVWVGTRVTILKGCKIGDNAVIGAGSVVTHDVPENSMAAGVPACVIKENVFWE